MMMGDLRVRWFILDVQKVKSNEALYCKIHKCSNYGWMEIKGNANVSIVVSAVYGSFWGRQLLLGITTEVWGGRRHGSLEE
jgi:hypothetical protein